MKERAIELIKVVSKQTIWDILERGTAYGKIMDVQGEFRSLSRGWHGYAMLGNQISTMLSLQNTFNNIITIHNQNS